MFAAQSHKGSMLATEERQVFLERQSRIMQFGILTLSLTNQAISAWEAHGNPDQKLRAVFSEATKPELGGTSLTLDVGGLIEQKEFLQKELVNQWFLMLYINFEALFSRWCLRAFSVRGASQPEQAVVELMMGIAWEGKFSRVQQKFGVKLGRQKTRSWMKSKEWSFSANHGKQLDDPTRVLDLFREKRNAIVHNDAQDSDGRVQANTTVLLGMMPILVDLSDLVERAFVKEFGWERRPVDYEFPSAS